MIKVCLIDDCRGVFVLNHLNVCVLYIFLTLKNQLFQRNVKALGIGLWEKTVTLVESYGDGNLKVAMRNILSEVALITEAAPAS